MAVCKWNRRMNLKEMKNFKCKKNCCVQARSSNGTFTSTEHSWIWSKVKKEKKLANLSVHLCISCISWRFDKNKWKYINQCYPPATHCLFLLATYHGMNWASSPFASSSVGAGRLRSIRPWNSGSSCLRTKVLPSEPPIKWDLLWPPKAWPDRKTLKQIGHSCPLLFLGPILFLEWPEKLWLVEVFTLQDSTCLLRGFGTAREPVPVLFSPLSYIASQ